jgi:hypothetical protein
MSLKEIKEVSKIAGEGYNFLMEKLSSSKNSKKLEEPSVFFNIIGMMVLNSYSDILKVLKKQGKADEERVKQINSFFKYSLRNMCDQISDTYLEKTESVILDKDFSTFVTASERLKESFPESGDELDEAMSLMKKFLNL